MRILLAGATGAVGSRLVPLLVARGHAVVGTTRSLGEAAALAAAGAEPLVLDILDRQAVLDAVRRVQPEVVVHQATALGGDLDLRRFDRAFAPTNALRTAGTDNLLAAAQTAGTRRFVAQSFAGWPYARTGGPVKTESDPLDPTPPAALRSTLAALQHLERAVTGAAGIEGTVLRYGGFYGPGTSLWRGGSHVEAVRRRRFPIFGAGTGIWSFVHLHDVAQATLTAVEHPATGLFNVVDDEPAPVAEWLPYLAQCLGAPPPPRFPAWPGRLLVGEHLVVMMNDIRGASNARIKNELGWQPRYASWREGFREVG